MTEGMGDTSVDSDEGGPSGDQISRVMGASEPEYLRDTHLEQIEDDDLEHKAYVDLLESIIWNNEPPWHIGVFGTWGSGKTSIIELLFDRIDAAREGSYKFEANDSSTVTDSDSDRSETETAVSSPEENKPNYPFSNIACVKIDAWQHSVDSIQTSLILDLNKELAKDTTGWPFPSLFPERRIRNVFDHFDYLPSPSFFDSFGNSELLDSEAILNTLHDVEERKENSIIESIVPTLKDLAIQLVILVITLLVLSNVLNVVLGTSTEQLIQFGAITFLISTALRLILTTSSMTGRTMVNPRQEWSGAYEELFNKIIDKAGTRYEATHGEPLEQIIIVIDDLDRCESKAVYETLVALKSFMDHDRCTYIIPCDDDALYQHLKASDDGKYLSNKTNQRDFLAKFFDTQVPITTPDEGQLRALAQKEAATLDLRNHAEIVSKVILNADLQTPRRVILALNRTLTLQKLVERRDPKAISIERRADMLFLAKIAIIQEDFPEFLDALSKGRVSLPDLLQPYDDKPTVEDVTADLDTIGITGKHARRLAEFLIATREIDEPVDPYLNLSGDEVDPKQQFIRALTSGRVADAVQRIESADSSDVSLSKEDYFEVLVEQLQNESADAELFHTVVKVAREFEEDDPDEIWEHAYAFLSDRQDRPEIIRNIEFRNLSFLASFEENTEKTSNVLQWFVEAAITEEELNDAALERLFRTLEPLESQLDALELEPVRTEFARRLKTVRDRGQITQAEYRKIVDRVAREYRPLYSCSLLDEVGVQNE
ncbi:hypothetical protein C5C07_20100 [Haloferax sp. Atlit-4N]|uniref:P-loop NTPase fold protein n=1 Tax=Haloferax sp. Atlit-4N TaxID=2077206 RepID=UPI000E279DAD|nr:P-loop NTPase fold protein [Haloferax sp. Atlit-4N]RDZ49701.1 hypothetical protein C5C07_20100 [Haloferax sp. Atlit-4N]